jgi:hypothetical protein
MRRRFANYVSTFRTADSVVEASSPAVDTLESGAAAPNTNGSPVPDIDADTAVGVLQQPAADRASEPSTAKKAASRKPAPVETSQRSLF